MVEPLAPAWPCSQQWSKDLSTSTKQQCENNQEHTMGLNLDPDTLAGKDKWIMPVLLQSDIFRSVWSVRSSHNILKYYLPSTSSSTTNNISKKKRTMQYYYHTDIMVCPLTPHDYCCVVVWCPQPCNRMLNCPQAWRIEQEEKKEQKCRDAVLPPNFLSIAFPCMLVVYQGKNRTYLLNE